MITNKFQRILKDLRNSQEILTFKKFEIYCKKIWRNFSEFQEISKILKHFKTLQEKILKNSKNSKGFQETSRNFKRLKRMSRVISNLKRKKNILKPTLKQNYRTKFCKIYGIFPDKIRNFFEKPQSLEFCPEKLGNFFTTLLYPRLLNSSKKLIELFFCSLYIIKFPIRILDERTESKMRNK